MIEVVNITGMFSEFTDNGEKFTLAPAEKRVVNDDFINRYRGLVLKTNREIVIKPDIEIIDFKNERDKVDSLSNLEKCENVVVSSYGKIAEDTKKYSYIFSKNDEVKYTIIDRDMIGFCRDNGLKFKYIMEKMCVNKHEENDGHLFYKGWAISRVPLESESV